MCSHEQGRKPLRPDIVDETTQKPEILTASQRLQFCSKRSGKSALGDLPTRLQTYLRRGRERLRRLHHQLVYGRHGDCWCSRHRLKAQARVLCQVEAWRQEHYQVITGDVPEEGLRCQPALADLTAGSLQVSMICSTMLSRVLVLICGYVGNELLYEAASTDLGATGQGAAGQVTAHAQSEVYGGQICIVVTNMHSL